MRAKEPPLHIHSPRHTKGALHLGGGGGHRYVDGRVAHHKAQEGRPLVGFSTVGQDGAESSLCGLAPLSKGPVTVLLGKPTISD